MVRILLTNDDGIYAPGLAALETELASLGEVQVVAPATEQSGVGHSITFLSPLICHRVFQGQRARGWSVEGSPADCVKLGVFELFEDGPPDLVVSGVNSGLNAGINVLYSGTVAAAIEAAFFGITSVAVSLEYSEPADFERAARVARQVIQQLVLCEGHRGQLFNLNIPTAAVADQAELKIVPMGVARYGDHFIRRQDPKGRTYYWATDEPPPQPEATETDLTALADGFVTLTPLQYDMTKSSLLGEMSGWGLALPADDSPTVS